MRILQARILEWSCNFLLQDIFPIQGSNPGLPHCKQILYHLSYQEKPMELERVRHNLATEQQQPGWEPHFPQKNSKILLYTCIFWGSTGPCQSLCYRLFVDGCSFVSVFFPFPDKQLLESTIWNSGKFKRVKPFSYRQEIGDMERICTQDGPIGSCIIYFFNILELFFLTFSLLEYAEFGYWLYFGKPHT